MSDFEHFDFSSATTEQCINRIYSYALAMQVMMSRAESARPLSDVPDDALEITRLALSDLASAIEHEQCVRSA